MKKPNRYDYILSLFTGNNEMSPSLKYTNKANGNLYSTDGYTIVRVPDCLSRKEYEEIEGYPNAEGIFQKFKGDKKITFNTNDLLSQLMTIDFEWHQKTEPCPECKGSGSTKCECCGSDIECKKCDGEAFLESKAPLAKLELFGQDIRFFERKYNPKYLHRILISAMILGIDEIEVTNADSIFSGALFKIKECDFIIMSVL
jgi:hypothetical protein